MMRRSRFVRGMCLLLCALVCLSGLVGCTAALPKEPDISAPTDTPAENIPAALNEYDFTLPWYRNEGFNPYLTTNSLTLQLADLLFEKLVVIDPDGKLEYRAVRSVTTDGLTVTLRVDPACRYADGSAASARDVAASLEAARSSQLYKERFAHVQRITAAEDDTVTVQLREADHLFAWLLDIPLMPVGQTALSTPLASGRYTYSADGNALVPNPIFGADAPFDRILLWEMTGADALANSLNIGAISLYSSEAEGLANGINSSRQASFYTNTMVFLGFNSIAYRSWKTLDETGAEIWHTQATGSAPLLADARGRCAVSSLLDRPLLLEKVYYNRGHSASGFLNTVGPEGGSGSLGAESDPALAEELLHQCGLTRQLDGYYHYPAEDNAEGSQRLELRLLVYSGSSYKRYLAQLIADALDATGIYVVLDECDSMEKYRQKLALLDFDMYIGEIKLYNNMDMSAFLQNGGAANAGITVSDALPEVYAAWRAGTAEAAALEQALAAEMPWSPVLWRSGTLYYAKALDGFTPSASSVFYGMEQLRLS